MFAFGGLGFRFTAPSWASPWRILFRKLPHVDDMADARKALEKMTWEKEWQDAPVPP